MIFSNALHTSRRISPVKSQISRPTVKITPVNITFYDGYCCEHYFYVPCLIMTSQWTVTLLGTSIVMSQ